MCHFLSVFFSPLIIQYIENHHFQGFSISDLAVKNFLVIVDRSPTKVGPIIQPTCTDEGVWIMSTELAILPDSFKLPRGCYLCLIWLFTLSFSVQYQLFGFLWLVKIWQIPISFNTAVFASLWKMSINTFFEVNQAVWIVFISTVRI